MQTHLHKYNCDKAQIADIFLGSYLLKYRNTENTAVITANISDFPLPLFKRTPFVVLNTPKSSQLYSMIQIDNTIYTSFR